MTDPDDLTYEDKLANGVSKILTDKDAEIKAWKQIAYNLSCALELNGLGGIASLKQQMTAHEVSQ